jgi:hypothetical protein
MMNRNIYSVETVLEILDHLGLLAVKLDFAPGLKYLYLAFVYLFFIQNLPFKHNSPH